MEANLEQSPLPKPEEHPPDAKEPFQKPKLLPVLAVILFASIVVLLAYSVRQRYQSANQLSPIPSPIPPNQNSLSANWKTYMNKRYSFSFNYPSEWILISSENAEYEPRIDLQHNGTSFTIYLSKFNSGLESIPILKRDIIKIGDRLITFDYYNATITKNLSGHSDLSLPENTFPFYMINFHLDDRDKDQDLSTIKQILSTFKFTDQNVTSASTSTPKIIPYTDLQKAPAGTGMATFDDPIMKVSFQYPKSYFQSALKADNQYLTAVVFFLKHSDAAQEKYVQDEINCEADNRKTPTGVCAEGMLGDVQVTISFPDKIPYAGEEANYDWEKCQKDQPNQNEIIYSCTSILNAASKIGNMYTVYLLAEKPVLIRIEAYNAQETSDLISSIISSVKRKP